MPKKKVLRRGGSIIGCLIIVGIITGFVKNSETDITDIYTVHTGDISVEVKVAGTAKLMNEQQLSFGREGKITDVYVYPGDTVYPNQILAEIDMQAYENNKKEAEIALENAKLGLERLYNNDTSLTQQDLRNRIMQTETSLQIEERNYTLLTQQLETALQQKKQQLAQTHTDIILAKKNREIAQSGLVIDNATLTTQTETTVRMRTQTLQTIRTNMSDGLDTFEHIVQNIDTMFGIHDPNGGTVGTYIAFLSAKDSSQKNQTEQAVRKSSTILKQRREDLNKLNAESTTQERHAFVQKVYSESDMLVGLCNSAQKSIEASAISSATVQQIFDGLEASITSYRNQITTQRSMMQSWTSQIDNLLDSTLITGKSTTNADQQKLSVEQQQNTIQKLEDAADILQKDIAQTQLGNIQTLQQKTAQIENLRASIDLLQNQLTDILDGADTYDIQQQNNMIAQAAVMVEKVQDQQKEYQIIADFTGRIRSIDIAEGEQYKLTDREYIVVENPDVIELELQVSQIDIVKISEGNKVLITFDAYPEKVIEAKVNSINVNPLQNGQGGVNYKATILLPREGLTVYAGMTAIATIIIEEKENVMVVPSLAIIEKDGKLYVHMLHPTPHLQEIKKGLDNNFYAEILEGIQYGDQIQETIINEEAFTKMGIDEASSSPF